MTQYIKKLPAVFQTTTEKKFFDATFDQVFSKKDSDLLYGYLGHRVPGTYNPISDFYIPEPTKNRTWWQLEATSFSRKADATKTNVFFYEDLLNRINYYGGNTLNQDRLFESDYYSWSPPIDPDMFANYQNYYWIDQGLPPINISGVVKADIVGKTSYTTPPTATPANFALTTGMRIVLIDESSEQFTVENIGSCIGIRLVPQYADFTPGTTMEFLPWDGSATLANGRTIDNTKWDTLPWVTEVESGNADYITIERGALDRNAWSRTNKWFHISAISATLTATGTAFPIAATRALRPIIQFTADLTLYKAGTQFRSNLNYGLRNDALSNPLLLSNYQGQPVNTVNLALGTDFVGGELVCFFNDPTPIGSATVKKYIFQTVVSGGNVTFTPVTDYTTPILEGDIVFVTEDATGDSAGRGQTWYFSQGTWQEVFNDKVSVNQAPLFQLFDHNGIPLDDPITYPLSNFEGSKIFSYKINITPGAFTDPVLKFPIVYTSLGQASDIVFQNNLIVDRYTYGSAETNIDGYYYYTVTDKTVLHSNWNLYQPCPCSSIVPPPPANCIATSKQRVIDRYVVGYGTEFQFRLSVTPFGYVLGAGTVQPLADIQVTVNGVTVKNETGGYLFEEINNTVVVNLATYLTALLTLPQSQPPVVEIHTYTHDLLDPAAPGYFEIPQQLEANPNQLEITEINGSDLSIHFASIIANQVGATGTAFGGDNNYRDTFKNTSVGSYILQNVAPLLKTMLVSSSDDLDFIAGARFSQDEYTKFKNKYLNTALQLINRGFDPVQYHNNTIVISAWVEEILKTITISSEFSKAFAYSYMIANGSPYVTETHTVPVGGSITLTNYIDLTDERNALYVYDTTGQEKLLVIGQDYEITSTNLAIDIQFVLANVPAANTVTFAFYKNPVPAYVPSTPSKVGAYPVYLPRMEMDYSYTVPAMVIVGHDGSKTIAYGDYRDNLLLEFEKRIYNLIQHRFRNQYYVPLRVESVKSGHFRQTRYSRQEFLDITESYLNKWSAKYRANYRANDWASASVDPLVNPADLWKLYNYRYAKDSNGALLNLPGNWKGVFQYYYDTIYPDTRPWEMLGFSQQPTWWVSQYGSGVVNANGQQAWPNTPAYSLMWADLEYGIIRQGPSAIYNPITELPQEQPMWARPGLSAIIPVDASGNIRSVMSIFSVAYSGNPYAPFDKFDAEWVYGDGGPVEQAWMSTSSYAFCIQEFLYLMKPAAFGELLWDTIGTELSAGQLTIPDVDGPVRSNTSWQYVQNDTFSSDNPFFAWMRPKNSDQVVHAELVNGIPQIRFGYQRWISDRILFLGKDITDTFGQLVRTLDVNLANKLAGFTNKDTTTTYIESVSPGVSNTNLLIPSNNFDVLLHKSQPIKTYSYSGVVIRALADGTFVVYGYDLLNSEFIVLNRTDAQLIDVTVGGTPAEFQYFTAGATYNEGDIVRYNGVYYVSRVTQTVSKFNSVDWQKLKMLPTIGGVSVTYRPISDNTYVRVPYGTVLKNAQEVFDLLIGWGAYLETQGWAFDQVDPNTNQLSDWLYSAKQFLFWLNTSWAPDASIQLSPSANSVSLTVQEGYPNDVETISNGVYSILDKHGVAIPPNSTTTNREGKTIQVAPTDLAAGGIYFLQVSASETEHILIFDNSTSFGDVIYNPLLRVRQGRLRFNGFRSNGWYGKMEAPGYLVIDDKLVPNFDTIVDAMRYFYDPDVTIDNPSLEDLGRHLIGYESKSYLDNLQVSNDVQYLFYQGAIRQKGTIQSFDKLFRSTKVRGNETIEVYEEWALKTGTFGNTVEQVSTEFILRPEQNSGEVIVARLNFVPSAIGFVKQINIFNAQNVYKNVPSLVISLPDAAPTGWTTFSTLNTYNYGDIVRKDDAQGNPVYYSSIATQGPGAFNSANWTIILQTRRATAYVVLNSNGVISRVDITDGGYGYATAPSVTINSGLESNSLDRLYAVWQGEITRDPSLDNIVDIDIDDTDLWISRPVDPSFSLEFPMADRTDYVVSDAGYVNFDDVTWSAYNDSEVRTRWGTGSLNPVENDSIWIANTFTKDWGVYKLTNVAQAFEVFKDQDGNLTLKTPLAYLITPQLSVTGDTTDFGNLIVLQVIEAHATATVNAGTITAIDVTKTGAGYITAPTVTITDAGLVGTGATATARISGGIVTEIIITSAGTGYVTPVVTISPPTTVNKSTNYVVGFAFSSSDAQYNYYQLVSADGAPLIESDVPDYANFTKLMLFKTLRFPIEPTVGTPSYVSISDKIWVDGINVYPPVWKVFTVVTPSTLYPNGHRLFRQQEQLINTTLFRSARIYEAGTEQQLVQLSVYDPFKGIFPGIAKQNLSYITSTDPTQYNVTGDVRLYNPNITFGEAQVGQLWWDTSTVRYVYYEQPMAQDGSETATDNLAYRRDHWGQIFPGSTVDIYEWTKSPVPPAEYTKSGTPRSTTDYVQISTTNRFTGVTEINYYFWVLNVTTKPTIENRTLAALEVSRLLSNPKGQKFAFYAPIQQTSNNNSYMFSNTQEILMWQGNNVQIGYRVSSRDDQKHTQWGFFREGDPASTISPQYWNKLVDSLCGYTKVLPVSDEWNGISVGNSIPWDPVIIGEVLPVPDPALSEAEKYGIGYRPRQSMFVNLNAARKILVQSANNLLKHIPIRDNNPAWNTYVSTNVYWNYTNWYEIGFENAVPSAIFQTLSLAQTALTNGELENGTIVEVVNGTPDGRYVMYNVVQVNPNVSTQSFDLIAIEASAINLLDTIYTTNNVYSLAVELRELLTAFRDEVFVDSFIVNQNELYFSLLNYVMSEQKNPNWVFKSSYIYIKENNLPLTQSSLYIPNQIDNIIGYITDAKPYHTQIRDYTSTYLTNDIAPGTASDEFSWNMILKFGPTQRGHWDTDRWDTHGWDTFNVQANLNLIEGQTYPATSGIFGSNPLLTTPVQQFISQENVYTIDLTTPDPSKKGYSSLYPYTFSPDVIFQNPPPATITPRNIVGIQIGTKVLYYGVDYFVGFNRNSTPTSSGTYTVYFFNDPSGGPAPKAIFWLDGGSLETTPTNLARDEIAAVVALDNLVVNVDTKLPVNDVSSILAPLTYAPYVGWGDVWDAVSDPVAQILVDAGGTASVPWDAPLVLSVLPNTISFKTHTNASNGSHFYRNAETSKGILMADLLGPTAENQNLDVITVFVDPATHPITTDILPDPAGASEAVWINGERVEYRIKTLISANTWELRNIRRGTEGTAEAFHPIYSYVWVERGNEFLGENDVWNASDKTPDLSTVETFPAWAPSAADPTQDYGKIAYQPNTRVSYLGNNYYAKVLIHEFENTTFNPTKWQLITVPEYTSVSGVPLGGIWYA